MRCADLCETATHGLPFGLSRIVAPSFSGFHLNRTLDLGSQAQVGTGTARYFVVADNVVVLLPGVTTLIASADVPYQLARLLAAAREGFLVYAATRWFVLRRPRLAQSDDVFQ